MIEGKTKPLIIFYKFIGENKMKKIFMSILAIALTIGAVSGTAYALFSDTTSISGITITSGNADLQVALSNEPMDGVSYTATCRQCYRSLGP